MTPLPMSPPTPLKRAKRGARPVRKRSDPAGGYQKSVEKRKAIVDAGAKMLARYGYAEAKISDIAREVGIHAGSLYYYFPSREDLVQEVMLTSLERMLLQFSKSLESKVAGLSALDRLEAFIRAILARRAAAKDDYLRAYMRNYNQVPPSMRKVLAAKRHEARWTVERLIREAQVSERLPASIDTGLAALFVIGAATWVGMWYEASGPKTPQEISDTFVTLILHGLLGASGPGSESRARR